MRVWEATDDLDAMNLPQDNHQELYNKIRNSKICIPLVIDQYIRRYYTNKTIITETAAALLFVYDETNPFTKEVIWNFPIWRDRFKSVPGIIKEEYWSVPWLYQSFKSEFSGKNWNPELFVVLDAVEYNEDGYFR